VVKEMTVIRKGITGFRHVKDAPLPRVALATFKSACYGIAPSVDAKVEQVEEASVGNNYHSTVLQVAGEQILVLCNCVFPVLAFATPNIVSKLEFIKSTTLADAFSQIGGFGVATKTSLDKKMSTEVLADLSPVELEQVRKWKPRTVGEVVFNLWD
jgi:hypothetical protein